MKKVISMLTVFCLVLSLTACGSKMQSVTYCSKTEESGLKMTDTMTMEAKGDSVQSITEEIEMDLTGFDEETQKVICGVYDELVEQYQSIEGVEGSGEITDGIYTMHIVIDATGDAVSELAGQGLLEVDGDTNWISLQKTMDSLESNGYEKVK